ncbi:hypothetical protein ACFX2I_037097 [Malus domestica]
MNNQMSRTGLELANLLVTSPLHQSWDAVQKQKLQTASTTLFHHSLSAKAPVSFQTAAHTSEKSTTHSSTITDC